MKKFFFRSLIVLLVAGIIYVLLFSIVKIEEGHIGVVEDLKTDDVSRVYSGFAGNFNFIWQGSFPWRYVLYKIPSKNLHQFTVPVVIPELAGLNEDYYRIKIPVKVIYVIDINRFKDIAKLKRGSAEIKSCFKKSLADLFSMELNQYLTPLYNRDLLLKNSEEIGEKVRADFISDCKSIGIDIERVSISGSLSLPDMALYYEGVQHAAQIRRMDKELEIGMKSLKGEMDMTGLQNKQLYDKLMEISRIIKQNPDILKYIYIDKLGGNVKLILSSDNTGLPAMLQETPRDNAKKKKKEEVDNLR